MKKLIWGFVIVAVVAVFGGRAWYLYQHRDTNDDVVKIGVLGVLSGQYAFIGEELTKGVTLASEELKKSSDLSLVLNVEDGKGKTKDAVSGYNKLLFDKVDTVIVMGDNQVPVAAPLAVEHKIPTIGTITGIQDFLNVNKEKTIVFNNWPSTYIGCLYVGKYAKENLNLNNVGVIYMSSPLASEALRGFREGFGKDFVVTETFKEADIDTRSQVLKVMAQNPDAVFVVGFGPGFLSTFNRLKEMKYPGVILSDNKAGATDVIAAVKDLSNIYYYDTANVDNELSKHFQQAYLKRFGAEPSEFARTGYDSVMRIAKAIELKGKDNIRDGLAEIKEMDTTSGHLKFLPNGGVEFPLVIKQMQADKTEKTIKE